MQISRVVSEREGIMARLQGLRDSTQMTPSELEQMRSLKDRVASITARIDQLSPNRSQLQEQVDLSAPYLTHDDSFS
jgi:hypothetical protein